MPATSAPCFTVKLPKQIYYKINNIYKQYLYGDYGNRIHTIEVQAQYSNQLILNPLIPAAPRPWGFKLFPAIKRIAGNIVII